MKSIFLFFSVTLFMGLACYSQSNRKTLIQGTWSYVDEYGKTQQLLISKRKWTVNENEALNDIRTEWQLVSFSGKYRFTSKNKIHIIYNFFPREQEFTRIIEITYNKLVVERSAYRNMKNSQTFEYLKE